MEADLKRYLAGEPVSAQSHYPVRRFFHRNRWPLAAAAAVLMIAVSAAVVSWQLHQQVPGCLASEGRYRTTGIIPPPAIDLVHIADGDWKTPDYSAFRIVRSCVYFDLSGWQAIGREEKPESAGRVEPAAYTRVIDLVRKESTQADNARIRFLFLTGGYDVDLRCETHPCLVRGSANRVKLGGGTEPVLAREIEIDVSRECPGREFRVVLNGTIWNGFQHNDKGLQWAALLAPDDMSELELAVRFPPGMLPDHGKARLSWFLKGEEVGNEPKGTPNFHVQAGPSPAWWVWRPKDIKRNHVYKITWEWVRPKAN